jgi:mono/diheme cytochrome c family protein
MITKFSVLALVAAVGLAVVQAQGTAQGRAQGIAQGRAQGTARGSAQGSTTLTSPVTGNAVAGKKLYYDHACYSCHGFNGETGARAFVPNWPANLATERSFIAYLRGRANVAPVQPSTSMPNYPVESVSDAQAKDIYAYIRSFKSAQPPVEKIPVMNQILAAARKPYKP